MRKLTPVQRENRALDALIFLAFHPELLEIREHDVVYVRADLEAEGYSLKAGKAGTIVNIYRNGVAFAVEFSDLEAGGVVVTLREDQIEKFNY